MISEIRFGSGFGREVDPITDACLRREMCQVSPVNASMSVQPGQKASDDNNGNSLKAISDNPGVQAVNRFRKITGGNVVGKNGEAEKGSLGEQNPFNLFTKDKVSISDEAKSELKSEKEDPRAAFMMSKNNSVAALIRVLEEANGSVKGGAFGGAGGAEQMSLAEKLEMVSRETAGVGW